MQQIHKSNQLLLNLLLFALFLLWNFYQPLTADDYGFTYFINPQNQHLFEVVASNYATWTGRVTAVVLVNILLGSKYLPISIIFVNCLNSIAAVITLNVIYKLIFEHNYSNLRFWLVSTLFIGYYVIIGTFSQDFLWKTVAIQYLYGFALLVFILWQFYQNLGQKTSYLSLIFYSFAAILLGFYSEIDIGFILSVYLSVIIVWWKFKKPWQQVLQIRYFVFIILILVSGTISIMAPGNYIRQATYLNHLQNQHVSLLTKLAMTYVQFFRYGYHALLAILLIWVGVWVYKNRKNLPQQTVESFSFLLVLLNINILSFVGVAYYSPISGRMLLIIDTLIFIILYRFFILRFNLLDKSAKIVRYKSLYLSFSVILFATISLAYYQLHQFTLKRQRLIDLSDKPQNNLVLPALKLNHVSRYIVYFDDEHTNDNDFIKLYLTAKTN